MVTKLEKELRFLKISAVAGWLFGAVIILTAFTVKSGEQKFEEITAKRIKIVDSNGKVGLLLATDYKEDAPGVFFFNGINILDSFIEMSKCGLKKARR